MDASTLGRVGERMAERHLAASGIRIADRRWRCRYGEIDLVAMDGDEVVFVEVKTRVRASFGAPEEAVTAAKRSRLRAAALMWLAQRGLDGRPYRIDVVAVEGGRDGGVSVRHTVAAVGDED